MTDPRLKDHPLEDQAVANKRRAALMLGAFMAVVTALFTAVALLSGAGAPGVVIAVLASAALTAMVYRASDALALAINHVEPADPIGHARLHNMVEGLCTAAGLPKPRVGVITDDAANAFAVGRDPKHAAVVVTTGLLDRMNPVELEGVLAHELTHVKNYDILASTLAVTLIGVPMAVLGPLGDPLMNMTVNSRRETFADLTGVSLTRYPPGLVSALEKLRDQQTVVEPARRATAHLWITTPGELEDRIQALREL